MVVGSLRKKLLQQKQPLNQRNGGGADCTVGTPVGR